MACELGGGRRKGEAVATNKHKTHEKNKWTVRRNRSLLTARGTSVALRCGGASSSPASSRGSETFPSLRVKSSSHQRGRFEEEALLHDVKNHNHYHSQPCLLSFLFSPSPPVTVIPSVSSVLLTTLSIIQSTNNGWYSSSAPRRRPQVVHSRPPSSGLAQCAVQQAISCNPTQMDW